MSNEDPNLMLSEEERAAMADDSPTDQLPAEVVDDGKPKDEAKPEKEEAKADAKSADVKPASDSESKAEGAKTETPADDTPPAYAVGFVPRMVAPDVPEDADAKLTELRAKFEAGDLTIADYDRERDAIANAKMLAEFAKRNQDAVGQQVWENMVDNFLDQNKHYRDDPILHDLLDATIKRLANDEANKDQKLWWFLREADRLVSDRMGLNKKPAPAAAPVDGKLPEPKELKPRAPVTLAAVPSSGSQAPGGDEYAHLDSLSGEALEKEVSKMSPAQKERYLAAG